MNKTGETAAIYCYYWFKPEQPVRQSKLANNRATHQNGVVAKFLCSQLVRCGIAGAEANRGIATPLFLFRSGGAPLGNRLRLGLYLGR
ncbi:MAG: hypothetical protein Q8J99_01410 [Sulfuritalea sp.]|nr:hypothetical protein [Sulfuritalea sp.]